MLACKISVRAAALSEEPSSVSEMSWQPTGFVELGPRVASFHLGLCDSLAQTVKVHPKADGGVWVGGEPVGPSSGRPSEKSTTEAESHK